MSQINNSINQFETIGTKLRRHAEWAHTKNPFNKTPVCVCQPWQWGQTVQAGARRVNGGNMYVCCAAGTTASSGGGPTGIGFGGVITDNTVYWEYVGANTVVTDPNTQPILWSQNTVTTSGQLLLVGTNSGGLVYGVVGGGTTSNTGTGPTSTSNNITDGTATLTFFGYYAPNPYMQTAPVGTLYTSEPSGYVLWSASAPAKATAPIGVMGIVTKGTGYNVGDLITLTGGTFSTACVLSVTSVLTGSVLGVSISTAGLYTLFPQTTVSQGSTTGSGTSFQCTLIWPEPSWIHINNGYLTGAAGGANNFASLENMITGPGVAATTRHISVQFKTDDPAPLFNWTSTSPSPSNMQILYDDGSGWTHYNQDQLPYKSGVTGWYTLTFPGGRKPRNFKIETFFDSLGANLPQIGLGSVSIPQSLIDSDVINCSVITDSLFDGNPVSPFSCGFYFANYVGYLMDWNIWDFSKGGTGYVNPGSYNTFGARVSNALAVNPQVVLLFGSTNDINTPTGSSWQASTIANVQSTLTSLRTGGFTGPIIVWGVTSVSASALVQEQFVQSAVNSWVDPFQNTWFVPFSNAAIPPIMGTYNNNPTPGGLSLSSINNFNKYINGSDNVHPLEMGVKLQAEYAVNYMREFILPNIL